MKRIVLIVVSVILLLTAVLCGCSQPETTSTVTGPAYAQPITESMLNAMSSGDYVGYILYLSKTMAVMTTEEVFLYYKKFYSNKIGDYESKSLVLTDVQVEGDVTTVSFKAKYTLDEDNVTVLVTFINEDGKTVVDHLSVNSPKMLEN